jgi:hypothetical protein
MVTGGAVGGGTAVGGAGRTGGAVVGADGRALRPAGAAGAAGAVGGAAVPADGVAWGLGAAVVVGVRGDGPVALGACSGASALGRACVAGGAGGVSWGPDPPGGATTIGTSRGGVSPRDGTRSAPVPASAAIDQPASSPVRPRSKAPRGGLRCCMIGLRWSWSD